MGADFTIKEGAEDPALEATLERDGSAFDLSTLSNPTVTFIMGSTMDPPLVNTTAAITDAANGVVEYAWQAGDTDSPGTYRSEFHVTGDDFDSYFPDEGYFTVKIDRILQTP